ncbi:hypothetical protein TCAL_03084, partial [Tigriopus californicus]
SDPAANDHLSDFTDLSDYDQGEGRLFFNLSSTISTAQAVALVLGITAVLGSIAALFFFFMLNMNGGGTDDSSHGSGYGSGSGGHSGGSGYGSGGGHGSYSKRSILEESGLLRIVSLIHELEQVLDIAENDGQISKECKMFKMCRTITNTSSSQASLLQNILEKAESVLETMENGLDPHPLASTDAFDLLNSYKTTAEIAKVKGLCSIVESERCT